MAGRSGELVVVFLSPAPRESARAEGPRSNATRVGTAEPVLRDFMKMAIMTTFPMMDSGNRIKATITKKTGMMVMKMASKVSRFMVRFLMA